MAPGATRLRPHMHVKVKGLPLKAVPTLRLVQASDQATEFLSPHPPVPLPGARDDFS